MVSINWVTRIDKLKPHILVESENFFSSDKYQ